jgi:lipoate-protein ligase B
MRRLEVRRLGVCEYTQTVALQEELVRQRRAGEIPDTLLTLEHEAVVTVGRGENGKRKTENGNGNGSDIPVVETSRGGQATYHGPGQLVAYPILDLRQWRTDLHWYLRQLEAVGIETVRRFGLPAGNLPGHTGVWIGKRKIASIGIAVRGWVTYHGLALNVDCDLSGFYGFQPCGLAPETMVSMRELGLSATVPEVAAAFAEAFQGLFGYDSMTVL